MDWWNLRGEHTEFEWAAQRALYEVCPFGERRADIRHGLLTANLIASMQVNEVTEGDFQAMVQALATYLPCDKDQDEVVDMDALKRMKRSE